MAEQPASVGGTHQPGQDGKSAVSWAPAGVARQETGISCYSAGHQGSVGSLGAARVLEMNIERRSQSYVGRRRALNHFPTLFCRSAVRKGSGVCSD